MADVKLSDEEKAPKKAATAKKDDLLSDDNTTREALYARLEAVLDVLPQDVAQMVEARVWHLVYDAEGRVPSLNLGPH